MFSERLLSNLLLWNKWFIEAPGSNPSEINHATVGIWTKPDCFFEAETHSVKMSEVRVLETLFVDIGSKSYDNRERYE